jgi:hypothetical protein
LFGPGKAFGVWRNAFPGGGALLAAGIIDAYEEEGMGYVVSVQK